MMVAVVVLAGGTLYRIIYLGNLAQVSTSDDEDALSRK